MLQLYPANQKPYIFCTIPRNFSLHNFNPNYTPEHGSIFPPICHQLLLSQSTTFGTSTPTHLQKVLDYIWHNNYPTFSTPNAWIGQSIYSTSPPIYLSQIAFVTIHLIWHNYSNTLAYYTGTPSSAPCLIYVSLDFSCSEDWKCLLRAATNHIIAVLPSSQSSCPQCPSHQDIAVAVVLVLQFFYIV